MPSKNAIWKDLGHQKQFLDSLALSFGIRSVDEWKNVTKQQVIERDGGFLLQQYQGSLTKALKSIHPGLNQDFETYKRN